MRRVGPLRDDLTRIEGGLTDRQKEWARAQLVELVARVLQEEAVVPTGVSTYGQLYDLTQDAYFLDWQQRVLGRGEGVEHPGETTLGLAVQLIQTDLVLASLCGYLGRLREVVAIALSRVKLTAHTIITAHAGQVTALVGEDKDGQQWQMYTSAMAPDSVLVRRQKQSRKPHHAAGMEPRARRSTTMPPRGSG